jgi:hypothetical protein
MRRLAALLALASLAGCGSAFTMKRLDIEVRNDTSEELHLIAEASGFSRTIALKPGQQWNGWVPVLPGAGDVKVKVRRP